MRGFSKKMLISILTSVIVFVTMVATTFAWVGIFTYANTEQFSINLKVQDLDSNYFLTISSSGEKTSFSNEVPSIDVKRQILNNKYDNAYIDKDDAVIESVFNRVKLAPSTANMDSHRNIQNFTKINLESGDYRMINSMDYYKFDLYLSVNTKEGISSSTTGIRSNVYLSNISETLAGTIHNHLLINGNQFLEMPSSPIVDVLKMMPENIYVNSMNSVRFAIELYEPISVDEEYSSEPIIETFVFQGGNDMPLYDSKKNVFDLGGCLPEDYNTALKDLYVIRPRYQDACNEDLQRAIDRNDLLLNEENSYLWKKSEHSQYLGCMDGIQTKMKLTVYFWFEGWDADCLKGIEKCPVTLNLSFTSGTDD